MSTGQFEEVRVCANPIFVVGSPRSGTTMLGWSLAQHSALWASGESYVVQELFTEEAIRRILENAAVLGEGAWLTDEGVDRSELLAYLGVGVNALYTSRSGDRRWIDHTPSHTLNLELIGDLLPGAVFLHILRDGRQVVHSMTNFLTAMPEERRASFLEAGWAIPWLDFRTACETWRDNVESAMRYSARQPHRCLTVVHRRLVDVPREAYEEIFEFLGIGFEAGPVDYCRSRRFNSSFPSQDGTRGEFIDPWAGWTSDQRQTFLEVAGDTMVRSGLADGDPLWVEAKQPAGRSG